MVKVLLVTPRDACGLQKSIGGFFREEYPHLEPPIFAESLDQAERILSADIGSEIIAVFFIDRSAESIPFNGRKVFVAKNFSDRDNPFEIIEKSLNILEDTLEKL